MRAIVMTLKTAIWLGWQEEANWTKTWIYILYAAVRPLSLCLIIFFLFKAVTDNPAADPNFISVYVGNAFYTIFLAVAGGISWVVIQDREHYRVIRDIYIVPTPYWVYVMGRGFIALMIAISSLAIILIFGQTVLGLPIGLGSIDWPLLAVAMALGIVAATAMGLIFAGLCLITARHSMLLAEGVGALFLLVSGVLYPIDFLPIWARLIGYALPMTYWMEAVRRAFGHGAFSASLEKLSTGADMILLTALTVVFTVASAKIFHICDEYAKRSGKIDQTTHY